MNTLYHYVHCPFCLRVRFVLGFLNIDYNSKVLPYHDEETPLSLSGHKMLPIFSTSDGQHINESLDIISTLDKDSKLSPHLLSQSLDLMLSELGKPIHNLCMPYWVYTKEFDSESRSYFLHKKEKKRGPFPKLMQKKDQFLQELAPLLLSLEKELTPFYQSQEMTLADIMIASHLWGLYIFPEFQFSEKLHRYLQGIKDTCRFSYHEDLWRD